MKMDRTDKEKLKQALLMLADEDCESDQEMDVSSELTDKVMKDYSRTASVKKRTLVYKWLTRAACFLLVVVFGICMVQISERKKGSDILPTSYIANGGLKYEIETMEDSSLPNEIRIPNIDSLSNIHMISSEMVNNTYRITYELYKDSIITYYQLSLSDFNRILEQSPGTTSIQKEDKQVFIINKADYSVAYSDTEYGYVVSCNLADDSLSVDMIQLLLSIE